MKPGEIYRLAWVFYLLLAIAGSFWVGWREGRIPLALFLDRSGWPADLALGAAAGLLLLAGWQVARRTGRSARELEAKLGELLASVRREEALALALLSGFAEELFFRGAVQGSWGWLPATILFALLHTGPGPGFRVWTLFAGLAGLVLAGLMLWRGNLLAAVTAHVLVNAVNLGRLSRSAPGGDLDPGG